MSRCRPSGLQARLPASSQKGASCWPVKYFTAGETHLFPPPDPTLEKDIVLVVSCFTGSR